MIEKVQGDLYLLQDGTHAAAGDISRGKDGVLRHSNGLAVALYQDGSPQTVARDAEANKNVLAVKLGEEGVSAAERDKDAKIISADPKSGAAQLRKDD